MRAAIERARADGITHIAFGDLFLEDIRAYRVRMLCRSGVEALFPIWCASADTPALARGMIRSGRRAVLACIDAERLPRSFAGRAYDEDLLADLPAGVDACGEYGEFHTFCCDGPEFVREVPFAVGETTLLDRFHVTDLLP